MAKKQSLETAVIVSVHPHCSEIIDIATMQAETEVALIKKVRDQLEPIVKRYQKACGLATGKRIVDDIVDDLADVNASDHVYSPMPFENHGFVEVIFYLIIV